MGREKKGMGAVLKGGEVGVGVLDAATAVAALDRAVVWVKKSAAREISDEALSFMVVDGERVR